MNKDKEPMKETLKSDKYGDSGYTDEASYARWLRMKKFGTLKERFLMSKGRGA